MKKLGLVPPEQGSLSEPTTAAYVFNGAYIPLACRLAQEVQLLSQYHSSDFFMKTTSTLASGVESRPQHCPNITSWRGLTSLTRGDCSYSGQCWSWRAKGLALKYIQISSKCFLEQSSPGKSIFWKHCICTNHIGCDVLVSIYVLGGPGSFPRWLYPCWGGSFQVFLCM